MNELFFFCNDCKQAGEETNHPCLTDQRSKIYNKGEHITYQNEKMNHLYFLRKGRVRTEIISDSGYTLAMESIQAPYPLAAGFLFADDNRFPVDIVAMEETEIVLIPREAIEKQMALCPKFLRGYLAFNANRMKYLTSRLKLFAQKGIKQRLAYYLLSIEKNEAFQLPRTVKDLAEYFGVERPSLSRTIKELTDKGVITYEAGKGTIKDHQALHNLLDK